MAKNKAQAASKNSSSGTSTKSGGSATLSRLTTFKKVVVRPGEYNMPAGKGKRIKKAFTDRELQQIAANINAQIAAGHKVPAPFAHYKDGKLLLEDGSDPDRFTWDSSINAGYWKNAQFVDDASQIDPSFKSGPALIASIDAPGDPADPSTPAGKIGTSVQDTSIAILPKYPDGQGKDWDNFVAHIAVPVHPIERSQDNFAISMSSDDESPSTLILSMADMVDKAASPTKDPSGGSAPALTAPTSSTVGTEDQEFNECISLLRSACYIDLPPSTDRDNFIQVLNIAMRQKVADQKQSQAQNSITTQPPGSQSRPAPVAMSADADSAIPGTVITTSDSESSQEETMADDPRLTALVNHHLKLKKTELHSKVRKLVGAGICEQQYADSNFKPEIEALTMSADDLVDGEFPTPYIEKTLNHVEEAARRAGQALTMSAIDDGESFGGMPEGAVAHERPSTEQLEDIPDEKMNSILNRSHPTAPVLVSQG